MGEENKQGTADDASVTQQPARLLRELLDWRRFRPHVVLEHLDLKGRPVAVELPHELPRHGLDNPMAVPRRPAGMRP